MNLQDPFGPLWENVRQMGAEPVAFPIPLDGIWGGSVDIGLGGAGIEIELADLKANQGLLSFRGRQVLLFIPDHSFRIEQVLENPSEGNKYHVADCWTIGRMRRENRFERYRVTNNLSGEFAIFGTANERVWGGNQPPIEGKAALNVCKNCLNMLNYKGAGNKGANNCSVPQRDQLVAQFSLADFFSTYSSIFKTLPKQWREQADPGYSDDWEQVSAKCRRAANYICQNCQVDLSSHKRLLHTHHINGDKSDNANANLKPLCADCHRKQPRHSHLFVEHGDTQCIKRLRREQGLSGTQNWAGVYKRANPAVHGVLKHCERRQMQQPTVGYKTTAPEGETTTLELAWPNERLGVMIGESNSFPDIPGWRLLGVQQAVDKFR